MTADRTGPRIVRQEQLHRLAEWSLRKPVIAVMGEFSSGKSTLMNLLLGRAILPTQVTATRMPPVWLRHGTAAPYRVDQAGARHPVDMADTGSIPIDDTRYIALFAEADILRRCDLIDTPGISDPSIKVAHWLRTVGYANAVMWCTHAGQAWRESERGMWEALPRRLRETSILLVTRKDKLRSEADRTRIDRRLDREAGSLFNARIFISLTDALRARDAQDAAAWADSGAQDFAAMLEQVIEGIGLQRSFTLARYTVPETAPLSPAAVAPAVAAPPQGGGILGFVARTDGPDPARAGSVPAPLAGYRLSPPAPPAARRLDLAAYRLIAPEEEAAPAATGPLQAAPSPTEVPATPPAKVDADEQERELIRLIHQHVSSHYELARVPRLDAAFRALIEGPMPPSAVS